MSKIKKEGEAMQKDTAIAFIVSKVKTVYGDTDISEGALSFYVEKLVNEVLGYCHRHDFPEPLLFTCVDLIVKRLKDEEADTNGDGDLKSLKMDDTTFEFNTATKVNIGILSDMDFDSIKPKLNAYRKLPLAVGGRRCHHIRS